MKANFLQFVNCRHILDNFTLFLGNGQSLKNFDFKEKSWNNHSCPKGGIYLGNHAKVVPKKIKIDGKEIIIEEGDFLIECTPNPKDLFLESFGGETAPACLVRIFRVENFNERFFAIWQTSEGLCIKRAKGFNVKFWGYDGTLILEKIMENVAAKIAPDCIKKQKTTYEVVKQEKFKTIISTLSVENKKVN